MNACVSGTASSHWTATKNSAFSGLSAFALYWSAVFDYVEHRPRALRRLDGEFVHLADLGVFPLLKSLLPVVVAFLLPTTDTLDHRRVGNGTHRHGLFQEPMEELPAMA